MADTYTVVRGDTLSEIAEDRYKSYGYSSWKDYMNYLVELNDIENANFIVVGQVLKLTGTATKTTNKTSTATVKTLGLLSNGTTLYASWKWDKSYTDHYAVKWCYKDPNFSDWIVGSTSDVTEKQATYSVPSGATQVKFNVKPIAQSRDNNGKTQYRWTAGWSTNKIFHYSEPPATPSSPTVTMDQYKLKAVVTNIDADKIKFQVVKDDKSLAATTTLKVSMRSATFNFTVPNAGAYKVRCQLTLNGQESEWSDYSPNVYSAPATPSRISTIRAESDKSVYLAWSAVANADGYDIEYATDKKYFEGSNQTTTISDVKTAHYLISGLESGKEYFFRIRAVRQGQESNWCSIQSVILGKKPIAPTTWSSTTTAIVGESVTLFWVHNAEDGSNERYSEIELLANGVQVPMSAIRNPNLDEEEAGEEVKTRSYILDTSTYTEGTKLQWRVRTMGILSSYGDWSTQRTIDVYAQPTLALRMLDSAGSELAGNGSSGSLTSFPFYIYGLPGPATQAPIGYYLNVNANQPYETTDAAGNDIYVKAGDQIYSKYFDINEELTVEFSPGNIDLENNIEYTVSCTAAMNSGLSVESTLTFQVLWEDLEYEPNAEIGIDEDSISATIRPYCEDELGNPIEGVTLSVYRREFDGGFTEIASGIENVAGTFVTDPHPALDYARYRVVAVAKDTGAISYCDIAPFPVGEKAAIIQWDEEWSSFEGGNGDEFETPNWSGSLLRLPYNLDVSDSNKADVAIVAYIGKSHPTTYYGTQLGHTSTWNVDVAKGDEETLYALRRLQNWLGDVYVREPSGSGYWANVVVSFNQKHKELKVPVTISVTRVEGGM